MILQTEFENSGYHDLLADQDISQYGLDLEDLYDQSEKPEDLLGIFISEQRDELFFLLNGDKQDVKTLCDRWDDRIRVFAILNGSSEAFKKLKYNIVQLIVYSGEEPDRSREINLQITRKIIIRGDLTDPKHIEISDDEAIELPFHMIPADTFTPNETYMTRLRQLLPADEDLMMLMKKKLRKVQRKEGKLIQPKSLKAQDYERIKEWLET